MTDGDVGIRPAVGEDLSRILELNRQWEHFLSPLDAGRLRALHERAAYHRVAVSGEGEVVAFLLAFREGADYASPNYQWFERRFDTFLYIDRIVVDGNTQACGVGRLLYRDILDFARKRGIGRLACEVDMDPPNPVSERFHREFGFREIGRQRYGSEAKQVALQVLET